MNDKNKNARERQGGLLLGFCNTSHPEVVTITGAIEG